MGIREKAARDAEECCRAKRLQQEQNDRKLVEDFLKAHGYSGVNTKRRRWLRSKYPLHTAAKGSDARIVEMLLEARADPTLKNSAGKTPAQVAQQLTCKNAKAAIYACCRKSNCKMPE